MINYYYIGDQVRQNNLKFIQTLVSYISNKLALGKRTVMYTLLVYG